MSKNITLVVPNISAVVLVEIHNMIENEMRFNPNLNGVNINIEQTNCESVYIESDNDYDLIIVKSKAQRIIEDSLFAGC